MFHKWKYAHSIRTGHHGGVSDAKDLEDLLWLLSRVLGAR